MDCGCWLFVFGSTYGLGPLPLALAALSLYPQKAQNTEIERLARPQMGQIGPLACAAPFAIATGSDCGAAEDPRSAPASGAPQRSQLRVPSACTFPQTEQITISIVY